MNDLSGSATTAGTQLGPIVSPYSGQIDAAAAGFSTTAMSTWQGTQQPTSDPQFTTVASPGAGDTATTSGASATTDPWMASFFDNGQTATTGSTANASEATEQQTTNDDDAATETAEGDASLPEPTVSGGFTTTTTVNGDATTTTYTLTSSISLESGSMAGGDPNNNSRWDIPTDWIDTASTIPEESDGSESDDSENDAGNANVTSDDETDAAPTDESGVRFRATATITVSVTTGPYTAPDGSTGTTTSITFGVTGSVVIMVSGSWSTGDEGNTGTVLTGNEAGEAGPATPPSAAESSMTRAPRELVLGGNGTSASASGEYFWYAYATVGFSVTVSNMTMDNGAPGGGLSAPSASLNLSLGSGSFSTDRSEFTLQESSESGSGSNAKSVQVKEKNVSGSATSFALNLGGDDATGEGDAGSSNAPSPSPISAAPAFTSVAGAADPADSSGGTTEEEDGPLSFSSSSFNRHQKTTLYATQSSQQSASSQSSSSTNADIEDSSSGSTSLSFSISGFEYETTSGSKSEFSYLSESQSSSDSPVGYDGRPSTHSEATSSHVIETLEESERTFGFGFGSDGLNVTNEYSSNDTVSDVLKSESTSGSWRLVYPIITSSLAMMTNPQSTAPNWVAGPELEMTSGHNIQFNYGGNLEDGFEGSYSETTDFSQEFLNQEGTVSRYEYSLPIQETFPNTNASDASNGDTSPSDDMPVATPAAQDPGPADAAPVDGAELRPITPEQIAALFELFPPLPEESLDEWLANLGYELQGSRKRAWQNFLLAKLKISVKDMNSYDDWTIPNQATMKKIYGYYASSFLRNSNLKWAGMAKLAGNAVWNGLKLNVQGRQWAPGIWVDLTSVQLERALVKMNKEIFEDLGWVHEAYQTGGIEEIRRLAAAGEIHPNVLQAFEDIHQGTVEGNEDLVNRRNTELLRREQQQILKDGYAFLAKMGIGVVMGALTKSPIPGGKPFHHVVPDGDLTNFEQRWYWIQNDMLPAWLALPAEVQRILVGKPIGAEPELSE